MRFKILLPWILLAGVLAYVYMQKTDWHPALPHSPATLSTERVPNKTAAPTTSGLASYSAAVKVATPAVVNIYTTQKVTQRNPFMDDPFFRRFFGNGIPQERQQSSLGSGVIASAEGYVLTNNHVVARADEIVVALNDGRETKAKVIGTDPGTDLAVLKIDLDNLPVLPLRESPVEVGDVVLAIGNPFGVGKTVTQGIISAIGRQGLGINAYEDFIQTDAAINPGNSGGALIDVNGNLVGINTAIYSQSGGSMGIGFAIPAHLVRNIMQSLIKDGKVVRGWMGVEIQGSDGNMPGKATQQNGQGVVIAGIFRGGPAHKAGLEPGDQITQINGVAVENATQVINLVAGFKPGQAIKLLVHRGDKKDTQDIEFKVVVGERPSERPMTDE